MRRSGVVAAMALSFGAFGAFGVLGMNLAPAGAASETALVTNSADAGPGSLRAALASGARRVVIRPGVGTITIASPLIYAGGAGLTVLGTGQVVDGDGLPGALLGVTAGADLQVAGLSFQDSGGPGVQVIVPATRTGTVQVVLTGVTVRDTADHGVLIDDETGSPAGVGVTTIRTVIERGGAVNPDQDGVRVNERGDGGISFRSVWSTFAESGGDGVELDEGGPGDVVVNDVGSTFRANGPLVPDDLEDGIDVDEADEGSVQATFVGTTFTDNFDEGADLNELGDGGVSARFVNVTATGTVDGEAIAVEEHEAGDVALSLVQVTANGNGNDGVEVEETDEGSLRVDGVALTTNGNGADGLHVEELAAGDVSIRLVGSTITGNADDGIQAEQEAPGVGTLRLVGSDVSGNGDDQLNLDGVTQI